MRYLKAGIVCVVLVACLVLLVMFAWNYGTQIVMFTLSTYILVRGLLLVIIIAMIIGALLAAGK